MTSEYEFKYYQNLVKKFWKGWDEKEIFTRKEDHALNFERKAFFQPGWKILLTELQKKFGVPESSDPNEIWIFLKNLEKFFGIVLPAEDELTTPEIQDVIGDILLEDIRDVLSQRSPKNGGHAEAILERLRHEYKFIPIND